MLKEEGPRGHSEPCSPGLQGGGQNQGTHGWAVSNRARLVRVCGRRGEGGGVYVVCMKYVLCVCLMCVHEVCEVCAYCVCMYVVHVWCVYVVCVVAVSGKAFWLQRH